MAALVYEIAYAFWFILPAYVANAVPVIFGGGLAIDLGKKWSDGKLVFGSHKTIRGFAAGLTAGTLVSVVQTVLLPEVVSKGFVLPFNFNILVGFMISLGALLGDLAHSFVKRRLGLVEGAALPVADQLDFVLGAILLSFLVAAAPPLFTAVIVVLVTPPIHVLTNALAYLLGAKKTPW